MKNTKRNFTAMTAAYCMGTFNDNLFKQSAMLLLVGFGFEEQQGSAIFLFSLPFILFASYGGYFADRFPKKNVVIVAKFMELLAMIIGGIGIIFLQWNLMLTLVFIMAAQSVLFSPALNGAIPENFDTAFVPRANGIIKMATTVSILLGIGLAGVMLDSFPEKSIQGIPLARISVAATCVLVSVFGIMAAMFMKDLYYKRQKVPFPLAGPFYSIKVCFRLVQDKELLLAFVCDAFFYGISASLLAIINTLAISQLGMGEKEASFINLGLMLGVAVGAVLMSQKLDMDRWFQYLPHSCAAMGLFLLGASFVRAVPDSLQLMYAISFFSLAGIGGGMFFIPFINCMQLRPVAAEKGRIIGTSYFTSFSAMGIVGLLYEKFLSPFFLSTELILWAGVLCVIFALGLFFILHSRTIEPTPAQEILS